MFILLLLFNFPVKSANLNITGELVEAACTLLPTSQDINVDFFVKSTKDFNYEPGITEEQPFSIEFIDCTSEAFNTLKITFTGQSEENMGADADYFLEVTGVNSGRIGISILNSEKNPIELGSEISTDINTQETITLNFYAYAKSTPDTLLNKTVVPGDFKATSTFTISYE